MTSQILYTIVMAIVLITILFAAFYIVYDKIKIASNDTKERLNITKPNTPETSNSVIVRNFYISHSLNDYRGAL